MTHLPLTRPPIALDAESSSSPRLCDRNVSCCISCYVGCSCDVRLRRLEASLKSSTINIRANVVQLQSERGLLEFYVDSVRWQWY
jgi:hypothetical protein